jgi:recombination protein RecT
MSTEVAERQENPTRQLQSYFQHHKQQIEMALPKHLNADRMCRLALTAFHQNSALMRCDAKSVFGSVVLAAQLGLEIGVAGQGYLVPYKGRATFVPGWQGLVDLVSRSGRATVWTGAVFEGDDFDFALGDRPFVTHKPCGEDDPTAMTHVYGIGRVNGSEWPVIEVWPISRVLKHRDRNNKVGDKHYSFAHWEMYARKVPLLQVLKYMPKSIELTNALAVEYAAEQGKSAKIMDGNFVTVEDDEEKEPEKTPIQRPQQKTAETTNGATTTATNATVHTKEPEQSAAAALDNNGAVNGTAAGSEAERLPGIHGTLQGKIAGAAAFLGPKAMTTTQVCEAFSVDSIAALTVEQAQQAISLVMNPPGT